MSGPIGTSLSFGAGPRVAGTVLHSSSVPSGIQLQGEPSTAFSLKAPTRCACAVATSIIQSSRPVAGAVACATKATCFESGDQFASTAFNFAGSPVIVFGAVCLPISTACSCSATS